MGSIYGVLSEGVEEGWIYGPEQSRIDRVREPRSGTEKQRRIDGLTE